LPTVPLHVVQRGNNRTACFFGDVDRRFYLKCLAEAAARRDVAVHAYVLMGNHVHLMVTPGKAGAVAAMLQDLGRKYVRVINTIHGRSGTLWEGRYKSSLISDERYLLTCHRYIELNPVRAGIVKDPASYPWSSHAHYVLGHPDRLITEHPAYLALGISAEARRQAFQSLLRDGLEESTLRSIREATNAGCALGTYVRKRGRPAKASEGQLLEEAQSGKLF
jgi:putative transposase